MPLFKRKITYFYEHHKGSVGNTAGFLKLEIRGEKVKININIQEPYAVPYKEAGLYFYHEAGDHLLAVKVGTVERVNGMLTYQTRTEWQRLFDTGRDLYTFDGVAVVYNDSHYFIGDFEDKNRVEFPLVLQQPVPTTEKEPENIHENEKNRNELQGLEEGRKDEKQDWYEEIPVLNEQVERPPKDVYDKCENCPYQKKREEQADHQNALENMLQEYPKLPMYGVMELFDCVRIHPRDIGKLDIRNWKLGVNSFLTHGYYTYQYLLLGKMRSDGGKERSILGVPGVYSGREKYLANMFGFSQFIPVKKTGAKTGEFGYWIVEIQ